MGVLDEAIREHLDLKRRRGATEEEIARAEAEALGPARRALYDDEADDEGFGPGETIVIPPADDAPAPPPPAPTRAVHDIDEELMPPPVPSARVDRPDLEATAIDPLEQDTVEHPPPSQLPFGDDEDVDDDVPPAPPAAEHDDGGPGQVSE